MKRVVQLRVYKTKNHSRGLRTTFECLNDLLEWNVMYGEELVFETLSDT